MNKYFHGFLMGVSVLPALAIMPAMGTVVDPITDSPVFVLGDITLADQHVVYNQAAFAGRRMNTGQVLSNGVTGYRNDFPNYQMVVRSLDMVDSDTYVGPVTLNVRELTNNDVLSFNYQMSVNGNWQDVVMTNAVNSVLVWNVTEEDLLASGVENPTAWTMAQFAHLDGNAANAHAAASVSFDNSQAVIDGAKLTANTMDVKNGSTLTFVNGGSETDTTAVDFLNSIDNNFTDPDDYRTKRWYTEAQYIDTDGKTILTANTINFDDSRIVVKKDAELIVNVSDKVTFQNSSASLGGAINNAGTMTLTNGVFSGNEANGTYTPNSQNTSATYVNGKGGAVCNNGTLTVGGRFENNTAFHGGAIYNINNGTVTVSDGSTFAGNYANVEGGAIANYGNLNIGNNVTFDNNKAFIKEGDLDVPSGGSEMGAAIYSEGTGATRTVTIGDNVKFTNNYSPFGNVYFLNANNVTIGDNVEFSGNSSQKAAGIRTSSTGAGNSTISIGDNAKFINNTITSNTGAAAIRLYSDDVTVGKNAAFLDNTGTAIYNGNSNITFGSNVTFSGNKANVANGIGGVLVNHGVAVATFDSGVFKNNSATTAGGAIYNKENAIVNFTGDAVFSGNTANGVANDIHNLGIVNVSSGTTTIDGGITGGGTLNIADGATLNIGTATVEQGTITLDGNMLATLRDGDAQITAGTFDGNGTLKLSLAGAGTYHVFGDSAFRTAGIDATSSVYDISWANEDKDLVATLKSVEDIAAENGIQEDTAAAVAGASQSTSEKLNDLSVKIQEKLAEATPAAKQEVEHAVKAVHPEAGSVVQSVSTAVQTTVSNLVAARMAAPISGRNGGDMNFTSGGVWAQGLFNKSKQNDAFSGYTRGIAAGMDGTINRAWTIGAGYSFAHSDISGSVRDTEIDSNTVFVYGQYKPDALYVSAIANYTWADYSEEGIAMGTPVTGDYNVDSFGGMLATGYDFDTGITPEVGLRYLHVNGDDYTNSMDVKSKLDSADYLTASLGAKYGFGLLTDSGLLFRPELRAAAKYDLMSDKTTATVLMPGVDAYTLEGERLSRFGGEFGIGLSMKYRSMDISVNYDIDVRKDYTSQTGMLKFRYNF